MVTTVDTIPTSNLNEVARRPLQAEECALLVLDLQEKLIPVIFNKEEVVRNAQLLIRLANILKIPVLLSTQYSRGLGETLPEIASLLPQTRAIDKVEFNAFCKDAFCNAVKALPPGRNTLLLCGTEAHICVLQTALGALRHGYLVHVASDAVGTRVEWNWRMSLNRMQAAGCVLSTTEMMMYELMQRSGSPVFKEMLQYLK